MITQRSVTVYGYVALAVMALMLVLVWQRLVPAAWYWNMFLIAMVLFLIRITLRLVLLRQQRIDRQKRDHADRSLPPRVGA